MGVYPISGELRAAFQTLFDDVSVPIGLIGADRVMPEDWYQEGPPTSLDPGERARHLRVKLEDFVVTVAAQSEELQCPEVTEETRCQVVGVLVALRELLLHFPEVLEGNK